MPSTTLSKIRPQSTHHAAETLIAEVATLQCVLAALEQWDHAPDDDKPCLGSAELVLRESIERLNQLAGDVESLQDAVTAREVAHV